jgi:membrane protein DedA with SNARE-associated domain
MLHLLLQYAYPLMIPLSLIEGPIVALAGGVGTASGQINPFFVFAIVMGGGLFQDVAYYGLGRWACNSQKMRRRIESMQSVRKVLGPLKMAWRERLFLTLVASKFAYGLYGPILITAGMTKAPFWRYLGESLALSAVVLAAWEAAGFGLAGAYGQLGQAANWVMIGLGVLAIGMLWLISRWAKKRLDVEDTKKANRPA